jgi:hypothetical protein
MKEHFQNIRMTPEKIVKMLGSKLVDISIDDAAKVLLLLKKIAHTVVNKYLER